MDGHIGVSQGGIVCWKRKPYHTWVWKRGSNDLVRKHIPPTRDLAFKGRTQLQIEDQKWKPEIDRKHPEVIASNLYTMTTTAQHVQRTTIRLYLQDTTKSRQRHATILENAKIIAVLLRLDFNNTQDNSIRRKGFKKC